jgi:hypothetical protein
MTSAMTATSPSATSAELPDLTLFQVLHRGLRTDAGRLADAVARATPTGDRHLRALARWYGHYRAGVHEHHHTEDTIFFPALVERVPVFDRHLGRIDAEHTRLSDVVDALADSLDGLAEAGAAGRWASAHAEAIERAHELHHVMAVHLDFEDADVLPLYVRHFGAEEYDDLGERALKQVAPRELPFTIPWVMGHADAGERDVLYAGAPLAFKVLWFASRRAHARSTAVALGGGEVR